MDFIGKLKFLWHKRFSKNQKMLGIIFGVVPEHQGKGVDGAIILASLDTLHSISNKYPVTEIKGIGDFNRGGGRAGFIQPVHGDRNRICHQVSAGENCAVRLRARSAR